MSASPALQENVLGPEVAGVRMTPEEFDAIEEYDENHRYELVDGVLVVTPIPLAEGTGPNELLGFLLYEYRQTHPRGSALDHTLPQQYVYTPTGRRIADRLIWTGLGRMPHRRKDVPSIAAEFVSGGRRSQKRDYIDKRDEYEKAGVQEYWIVDHFQRTLTVIAYGSHGASEQVVTEEQVCRSPLLPGFEFPLARLLEAADREVQAEE
jgi:Uma2 family endonuclease